MDITLHRRILVLVLSVALATVVAVVLPKVASAASPDSGEHPNNGVPPDAVDFSVITVGSCPFPVRIDISGKAKTVELPGGHTTIVTSPGARATLTNLEDPSKQVSYLITGAYHKTDQADGSVEVVTTGQALLFDESFGMFLVIGRFAFGFDEEEGTFDPPPTGTGKMIDVCASLS